MTPPDPEGKLAELLAELMGNGPTPHPPRQDQFFHCPLQVAKDLTPAERAELFRLLPDRLSAHDPRVLRYQIDDDWRLGHDPADPPTEGWMTPAEAVAATCSPRATVAATGAVTFRSAGGAGGAWGAPDPGIRKVWPESLQPGQRNAVLTLVGEGLLPEGTIEIQPVRGTPVQTTPALVLVESFHRIFIRTHSFDVQTDWRPGPQMARVRAVYDSSVPSPRHWYIDVEP